MGWQERMRPLLKRRLNYFNQYTAIVGKNAGASPVNKAFIQCLTQQSGA